MDEDSRRMAKGSAKSRLTNIARDPKLSVGQIIEFCTFSLLSANFRPPKKPLILSRIPYQLVPILSIHIRGFKSLPAAAVRFPHLHTYLVS